MRFSDLTIDFPGDTNRLYQRLEELRRSGAEIVDEDFRELVYDGAETGRPAEIDAPLVFTLNGFSKMFTLPGLKIGWMAVSGEAEPVEGAMRTIEMISDTFLPVNETAQFAVPAIFDQGGNFLAEYRDALAHRRDAATAAPCTCARPPAPNRLSALSSTLWASTPRPEGPAKPSSDLPHIPLLCAFVVPLAIPDHRNCLIYQYFENRIGKHGSGQTNRWGLSRIEISSGLRSRLPRLRRIPSSRSERSS